MEGGGWRVEDGGWRVEGFAFLLDRVREGACCVLLRVGFEAPQMSFQTSDKVQRK